VTSHERRVESRWLPSRVASLGSGLESRGPNSGCPIQNSKRVTRDSAS